MGIKLIEDIPTTLPATTNALLAQADLLIVIKQPGGDQVLPFGELDKRDMPAALESAPILVVGSGTPYTVTGSTAAVAMGTTSPQITVSAAGTYLVRGRGRIKQVGATFAGEQTLTLSLVSSDGTNTGLAASTSVPKMEIGTTVNIDGSFEIPPAVYTTINTTDTITLEAKLSATPSAGSVIVYEGSIEALRIK